MFRHQGFTLVEYMIGFAIIAILFTMMYQSFLGYSSDSKIRSVADEMQAGLQQTKVEAIKRNTLVTFNLTNTSWVIQQGGNVIATRTARRTESSFTVTPATVNIVFNSQGWTSPPTVYTILIANPAVGACASAGGPVRCLTLEVSAYGKIKECDPALALTDPRAC